ncbi:MAG: hypothetical protein ACUVQ5_05415 [Candidatus Methanomethylicaceae archaeon]
MKRGDGSVDSLRLVYEPEKPCVQVHGKGFKLKKLVPLNFVGFCNSVSYGKVYWKIELLPCFSIDYVAKGNGVKHSSFKGYIRNVVACIAKSLKGRKKLLLFFLRWLKHTDDGLGGLHQKAYMLSQHLKFTPQFLPRLKPVGLFEAN